MQGEQYQQAVKALSSLVSHISAIVSVAPLLDPPLATAIHFGWPGSLNAPYRVMCFPLCALQHNEGILKVCRPPLSCPSQPVELAVTARQSAVGILPVARSCPRTLCPSRRRHSMRMDAHANKPEKGLLSFLDPVDPGAAQVARQGVYIGGYYVKEARGMCQSPWQLEGGTVVGITPAVLWGLLR